VEERRAAAGTLGAFTQPCQVQPVHVAAYVEQLGRKMSPPSVKQPLACIRMLFDWLVTDQVMPSNPVHSMRGPCHSVGKGSTPVLSSEAATALLKDMDVSIVVGLRDRALLAVMTYTFARVGAVVALKVEDYYPQKKRWWLRLLEENGQVFVTLNTRDFQQWTKRSRQKGQILSWVEFLALVRDSSSYLQDTQS
jgi:site-specific recombinase XerD